MSFLSPESAFLLVSTKNTAHPRQEVCESGTSGPSAHNQKFGTIGVVNGYNIITLPQLHVFLAVVRVHVLGTDQKKSVLWEQEGVHTVFSTGHALTGFPQEK